MYLVIPKLSNTMAEPQSPFSFCAFCNLFQLTQWTSAVKLVLIAPLYFDSLCLSTEKLLVLLRDGRKLLGILRSFDQFGIHLWFPWFVLPSWAYVLQLLIHGTLLFPQSKCCSWRCLWASNCRRSLLWYTSRSICNPRGKRCLNRRTGTKPSSTILNSLLIHSLSLLNIGPSVRQDLERQELPAHMICVSEAEIRRVCYHLSAYIILLFRLWMDWSVLSHDYFRAGSESGKGCDRPERFYEEENGVPWFRLRAAAGLDYFHYAANFIAVCFRDDATESPWLLLIVIVIH